MTTQICLANFGLQSVKPIASAKDAVPHLQPCAVASSSQAPIPIPTKGGMADMVERCRGTNTVCFINNWFLVSCLINNFHSISAAKRSPFFTPLPCPLSHWNLWSTMCAFVSHQHLLIRMCKYRYNILHQNLQTLSRTRTVLAICVPYASPSLQRVPRVPIHTVVFTVCFYYYYLWKLAI